MRFDVGYRLIHGPYSFANDAPVRRHLAPLLLRRALLLRQVPLELEPEEATLPLGHDAEHVRAPRFEHWQKERPASLDARFARLWAHVVDRGAARPGLVAHLFERSSCTFDDVLLERRE